MRNARHLNLNRDGDVAFHLLGGLARVLGHNLNQGRDGVGIGLDIQAQEGEDPGEDHPA